MVVEHYHAADEPPIIRRRPRPYGAALAARPRGDVLVTSSR